MPLRIKISTQARIDQHDIWLYIADDNVSAADAQLERIGSAVRVLADYPDSGRTRDEFGDVRSFPVDQYVIYYRHDNLLYVLRILHAARDATKLLQVD